MRARNSWHRQGLHGEGGATATPGTDIGHQAPLPAARCLAAGAIDLIEQPDLLDRMQQECKDRTEGIGVDLGVPRRTQTPLYEPLPRSRPRPGRTGRRRA
ncbi:hypothetical protein [Streptomyces sp. NPDC088707]|uniref:hypothetical protein n=1 Tax=Streptomyces sp. NPDC088707 TaxID=3365871 RepID=UPI00381E85E9